MPEQVATRILSIQSSVCTGYVGNRAATFPLQLLGFDVSCINTVQLSTHTGYPIIKGQRLSRSELEVLFEGLASNRVDHFAGLLTGYVPGAEGIAAVGTIAKSLKSSHPDTVWVLDPVMGDEERGLYVSPEIPPLYKSLVHLADIITPNQFELEVLSGVKVVDKASLVEACRGIHAQGVGKIVVTTFRDPECPEQISVIGSEDGGEHMFEVGVPYYSRPYQGTGDMFASLLLAYTLRGHSLEEAVLLVLDSMKPVLSKTGRVFDELVGHLDWRIEKKEGRGAAVCQACELRIVESADAILNPKKCYVSRDL